MFYDIRIALIAAAMQFPSSLFSGNYPSLLVVHDLRCNNEKNPFGIDDQRPHFSWVLKPANTADKNLYQAGYQIQVATTAEKLRIDVPDIWNSGQTNGEISRRGFDGPALRSSTDYYWRVRVWEKSGRLSAWSDPAVFTTGLLSPSDWKGRWIADGRPLPREDSALYNIMPAPQFRKDFHFAKPIQRAYLYIAGLGYHEAYLNGNKIGDRMLEPGWTNYRKRIFYSSYDISTLVKQGSNAIGIWLGNGWYQPLPMQMWGRINLLKELPTGQPAFLLQLFIQFEDGTVQTIISDSSWRVKDSYILRNNIYLGELHDLQKKDGRWTEPGTWNGNWRPVKISASPGGILMNNPLPPVRIMEQINPVKMDRLPGSDLVIDFGKNFAGVIRLIVKGKPGQHISIRYGELLYDNGAVNVMTAVAGQVKSKGMGGPGAPDTAMRQDEFILTGNTDTLQPRFSYCGFRYAQLKGLSSLKDMASIIALKLYSSVERIGIFRCSDTLINRIYENSINTFTSNLHSVQSDCPHRERFGYGGDIAITAQSFLLNFDMLNFYRKTLDDYADAQFPSGAFTETSPYVGISDEGLTPGAGPTGWGYVYPLLLDLLFRYTADTQLIKKGYPHLKSWVDYLHDHASGLVIDRGISDHESLDPKPVAITETLFFYDATKKLAAFASLLGNSRDAENYGRLCSQIRDTITGRFLDKSTGTFSIGTQAAQAFPLYFEVVPEPFIQPTVSVLLKAIASKQDHVATGMFGTLYMLRVLSRYGQHARAWQIALQKTFPGWGYMIDQGATTIWEHWALSENTYSHNHPMWGSVCEWYISDLAGIGPADDAAGFNKIIVRPMGLINLDSLSYNYYSGNGTISIRWKKTGNIKDVFITIPVNTSAEIDIPLQRGEKLWYEENRKQGKIVSGRKQQQTFFHLATGSGKYHFIITNSTAKKVPKFSQ